MAAGQTTRTAITEIVPAEVIADRMIAKTQDQMVIAPLAWEVTLGEGQGSTFNFPQLDKDTAEDVTEGSTTIALEEMTLSETSVTVQQVAIGREPTKIAERTNRLGRSGFLALQVSDAAGLLAEMIEDDMAALFSSFSNTAGTSGADLTVVDMLTAIGKQRTAKARGEIHFVLDDQAALDLTIDAGTSAASLFNSNEANGVVSSMLNGQLGPFLRAPVWYTNLTDTANGAADVVSGCFCDGRANPEYASIGLVLLWVAEMDEVKVPTKLTTQRVWSTAFGVGKISAYNTKLVTDA